MPEYNNELSGALFRNNKGDNAARPDYRGTCVIGGVKYRISGWARRAKASGQPFVSLAFTVDTRPPLSRLDPNPDGPAADPTEEAPPQTPLAGEADIGF